MCSIIDTAAVKRVFNKLDSNIASKPMYKEFVLSVLRLFCPPHCILQKEKKGFGVYLYQVKSINELKINVT